MGFFSAKESRSVTGFTLIELMVAISVVAILSTIGLTVYSQGQKFARDSRRKTEIKQIQSALNLYYNDYKRYPGWVGPTGTASKGCAYVSATGSTGAHTLCNSGNTNSTGNDNWIIGLDSNYINIVPRDPTQNSAADPIGAAGTGYGYRVYDTSSGSGSSFTCPKGIAQVYLLYAKLENQNDGDRLEKKGYVWCGNQGLLNANPGHQFSNYLYVVGSYL